MTHRCGRIAQRTACIEHSSSCFQPPHSQLIFCITGGLRNDHSAAPPCRNFTGGQFHDWRSGSSDPPARAVAQGPLSSHTSAIFSRLDCLDERFTTTFAVIDMQFRQNPEAANNSHWRHQSRTIRTRWRTAVHDSPRRAGHGTGLNGTFHRCGPYLTCTALASREQTHRAVKGPIKTAA